MAGIKKGINTPELLAPAGSPESLRAAIEGGADAIYVGGTAFNARINAKNFTEDELREGIEKAHTYGAKVYIAANTLIYDRELDDYLRAAERAYLCGADALIVADIGAAMALKRRIPIELHASTQLSGHNVAAAQRLAENGFSRMVCAREMSGEDLRYFCENSPIEAEVFVHGALCVCHSGQCLFSSVVGGRSGNRGECAQPCRLPYRTAKGQTDYPLSLKDLCLAGHIKELCDMGVASFKIEGRMKSPEYVRDVTRIWRELIDGRRNADENDIRSLARIFSRGGFTDGYYTKRIDKRMLGIRSEEDKRDSRELTAFKDITKKIDIRLRATLREGEPMMLCAEAGDRRAVVYGGVAQRALTAPLTREVVIRNLSKLGATAYTAASVEVELDEDIMVPISALNALRRKAIEALREESSRSEADITQSEPLAPTKRRDSARSAVFYDAGQIPEAAYGYFDIIYTPVESYDGRSNGVVIPPVVFDSEREELEEMLGEAARRGARYALVGNIGHIELAKRHGLEPIGDIRLNVSNRESAAFFERQGLERYILSPELSLGAMRDIKGGAAVVYGRLPLMVTEKCVGKEIGGCDACNAGGQRLTDRRGTEFPVRRAFAHRSVIFNSVPIYMADREGELCSAGLSERHFIFTVESRREAERIIELYSKRCKAPEGMGIRRIK